ncbi:MAG: hypothetical protein ABWY07_00480, partial [Burkholderiales bacterium]
MHGRDWSTVPDDTSDPYPKSSLLQQACCALRFVLGHTSEAYMKRVTGIGGIFFKARDPVALGAWYKKHLGIDVQDWGGTAFRWTALATPRRPMSPPFPADMRSEPWSFE